MGRRPFRFMGRDPVSRHVTPPERVCIVEGDESAWTLCGQERGPGAITRAQLREAKYPPAICQACDDARFGITRGPRESSSSDSRR